MTFWNFIDPRSTPFMSSPPSDDRVVLVAACRAAASSASYAKKGVYMRVDAMVPIEVAPVAGRIRAIPDR
jgi:hypothetical protein